MDGWFLALLQMTTSEGWRSVPACPLVAIVWFLMHRPYCTVDRWRLGLRVNRRLLALSASHSFHLWLYASLCFEHTISLSHWSALTVSVWGLLQPWLTVDSCLCKLSLQLVFITLSWSTLSRLEQKRPCHIWLLVKPDDQAVKAAWKTACSPLQAKLRMIQNDWWTARAGRTQGYVDMGDMCFLQGTKGCLWALTSDPSPSTPFATVLCL